MQTEYYEKLNEIYKNATKPWTELAELNIATLNRIVKNIDNIDPITSAKKPEDFFTIQSKLLNTAFLETAKYNQEAFRILFEAYSQAGKSIADIMRETTSKTSETIKTSNKNRE